MCSYTPPPPPPPPPLAPPPPPPPPAPTPPKAPDPLQSDVNPAVRQARSKKIKNAQAQGTGALRIDLGSNVNTGGGSTGSGGGLN
jgi:hypothetical protein